MSEPSGSEPGYRHPHVVIVNKSDLRERIGTLEEARINEILSGLQLLTEPRYKVLRKDSVALQ